MSLNQIFLQQNCDYAIKHCDFGGVTGEDCANKYCNGFPATEGTCPQIGLDPQNCCSSSSPAACLNTWIHSGSGSGAAAANPCASVISLIASCSSVSPALFPSSSIYTSGPYATSLASCLCYDSDGTYNPDNLDGFASTCVASGSAAHPTYYPFASRLEGFCTTIAVAGASTTAAATATAGSGSASAVARSSNGSGSTPTGSSSASKVKNPLRVAIILLAGMGILRVVS